MTTPLRVPPAVRMKFEQIANRICNLARLDFADWPLRAHEIVGHLEERWREGADGDLNSEAAERRALELFGNPVKVAASLRRPVLYRLLLYRRYNAERRFAFLAAYILVSWLAVIEAHYRAVQHGVSAEMFDLLFPTSSMFFVSGMGSFFVGAAAVAVVSVMKWSPATENPWTRRVLFLRYALGAIPASASLFILVAPLFMAWRAWNDYVHVSTYPIYLGLVALSVVFGCLGSACMLAEVLNLPERSSRSRNRNVPFGLVIT